MLTQNKKRRNQNPNFTVNELVEILRHSNSPNIIVEGKDDVIIYRTLVEDYFKKGVIDIHQTGGREKLLHLYDLLSNAEKEDDFRHVPVAFIADRDMWLFKGIPCRYKDIIWTTGYSIENDLYSSAKLRQFVQDPDYEDVLTSISAWFAWKVEEYLKNNPPSKPFNTIRDETPVDEIDLPYARIVQEGTTQLNPNLNYLSQDHKRFKMVKENYSTQLRGKLIFDLLWRFLNRPNQGFQRACINAYALYNIAIAVKPDHLFPRLKTEVQDRLKKQFGLCKKYVPPLS